MRQRIALPHKDAPWQGVFPAVHVGEAAAQAWQWQQAVAQEDAARRPLSADAARRRSPTRLQHFSRCGVLLSACRVHLVGCPLRVSRRAAVAFWEKWDASQP